MTAVNIIVQPAAVHILTDGAVVGASGKVEIICSKIIHLPNINCAVAVRGPASMLGRLGLLMEGNALGSFDALKQKIVVLLKDYTILFSDELAQCHHGREFEVIVAGISESAGPSAYLVTSHDLYSTAWTVTDLNNFVCLPVDEQIQPKIASVIQRYGYIDDFDPKAVGPEIMEIQRAALTTMPGNASKLRTVGGFIQLTSIDTSGVITTRIIHRWPDRIGEVIEA